MLLFLPSRAIEANICPSIEIFYEGLRPSPPNFFSFTANKVPILMARPMYRPIPAPGARLDRMCNAVITDRQDAEQGQLENMCHPLDGVAQIAPSHADSVDRHGDPK